MRDPSAGEDVQASLLRTATRTDGSAWVTASASEETDGRWKLWQSRLCMNALVASMLLPL